VSDSLLYHGMLRDSTYMSLVEVGTPLHNVLSIGSFGTLLGLSLFQILLCIILHLSIQPDLLAVRCTKVLGYTARGYIVAMHYCIVVA
jgi:hypothetical protein